MARPQSGRLSEFVLETRVMARHSQAQMESRSRRGLRDAYRDRQNRLCLYAPNGKEGITALDAETGDTLWRTDYPVAYEPYEDAEDHGEGPKATPLFHNGKLFTLGISGTISSFDSFSGELVWQKPAPPIQPVVGTSASPIGDRDVVIIQARGLRADRV